MTRPVEPFDSSFLGEPEDTPRAQKKHIITFAMNFFGRPKQQTTVQAPKQNVDVASSIVNIRSTIDTLEKRENFMQKKIEDQVKEAKGRLKKGDKPGAMYCMKKKKMYEAEIVKLNGARMTLERQQLALESQATTMSAYNAMREGNRTMQAQRGRVDAEAVEEEMENIREEIETSNEIASAIGQPIDDEFDEAELMAELNDYEQEELEDTLLNTPSVPADRPVISQNMGLDLPEAPTTEVATEVDEEEEALRSLEAAMGM